MVRIQISTYTNIHTRINARIETIQRFLSHLTALQRCTNFVLLLILLLLSGSTVTASR